LPLKPYLRAPLPPAPAEFYGSQGAALAMWGNSSYGDCTFAGLANFRAIVAARFGLPTPQTSEDKVVAAYLTFNKGQDVGCVEGDVLNAAMKGIDLGGDEPFQLTAWATVDLNDVDLCKSAIALFGALYLGVELPLAAQSQSVWVRPENFDGDNAIGSWGGHCLLWSDFDAQGNVGLPTWGMVKPATLDWVGAYSEEAHVLLPAWLAMEAGVKYEELVADYAALQ